METMNGFVIFAEAVREGYPDERVILGAKPDAYSPTGFEYVTAVTQPRDQRPTSWVWGHYLRDLAEAVEDFQTRAKED